MTWLRTFLILVFLVAVVGAGIYTALRGPRWFLSMPLWIRLWLALAVSATGVAGILVELEIADEAEPVYVPHARLWPSVPLAVSWSPGLDRYKPQLEHAMALWNDEVGCVLFARAAAQVVHVRVLLLEQPCDLARFVVDERDVAATYYCPDGTAAVDIRRIDDVRTAYQVFAHELGHVLGLAHDPAGLMAPAITSTDTRVAPSPKDRRALAARYCR